MIYFFIWKYEKDSLKQFIETINALHSTIKLTAERSGEEIDFLDVNVRLRNRQLETDQHIKSNDTHLFLDSTSCHLYHCKKSIQYSQAFIYTGYLLIMKNLINAATYSSQQRLKEMTDGKRL